LMGTLKRGTNSEQELDVLFKEFNITIEKLDNVIVFIE